MGRTVHLPLTIAVPLGGLMAFVAGVALAGSALAQSTGGSASDFRLEPRPSPTAPVIGPVSPDGPSRASPPPQASLPQPAPIITVPPPPTAGPASSPTPRRTTPAPQQAPAAGAAPAPAPVPSAATGPLVPTAPVATQGESATSLPSADSLPPPRTVPFEEEGFPWWLWPVLAAGIAAAAGLGWTFWRRRGGPARLAPPEFVRPRVPGPEPEAQAEEAAPPSPPPAQAKSATAAEPLILALSATRMNATLVNAVLTYKLVVSNGGAVTLSDVAIAGDMISAHASVPDSEMLGGTGTPLPGLHRVPSLAPGESVELTGELRLPLSAIVPIRRGEAQLFVPLARLVAVAQAGATPVRFRQAILIGQEPAANARLQPFRLDLGPRLYSRLGQRPIAAAA